MEWHKFKERKKRSIVKNTESMLRYLQDGKTAKISELKKRLKLSDDEFQLAYANLIDNREGKHHITVIMGDKEEEIEITKEGLMFLRELDFYNLQTRQTRFNRTLVIATFLIASFGFIQFYPNLITLSNSNEIFMRIVFSIYFLTIMLIIMAMLYLLFAAFKLLFFDD